jgi:hypothetical protein
MTLLLSNDEVDRLLDMPECLEVFESAYRELGQRIGVTRTASQVFTRTRHDADALFRSSPWTVSRRFSTSRRSGSPPRF